MCAFLGDEFWRHGGAGAVLEIHNSSLDSRVLGRLGRPAVLRGVVALKRTAEHLASSGAADLTHLPAAREHTGVHEM